MVQTGKIQILSSNLLTEFKSVVSPEGPQIKMFPNGLSLLTHSFIMLLVFMKRLIEKIAEKMGWDIFKFKMNLYLRLKVLTPLTGQANDNLLRRFLAYSIILFVFCFVSFTMFVSLGSRLTQNSNLDFIFNLMKSRSAEASQYIGQILPIIRGPGEVYPVTNNYCKLLKDTPNVATLPVAKDVPGPDNNQGFN